MADSIFDFDPVAANNTSFASIPYGPNQLYHNQIDNLFRAYAGALGGFVDDLGAVNTVGGTATAVTVTLAQGFTAYGTGAGAIGNGTVIALKMTAAATGAATLNVNSIGTKKIRRQGDTAVGANDWLANGIVLLRYDTAYDGATGAWVLLNQNVASTGTWTPQLQFGAAQTGITYSTQSGRYIKIGPFVRLSFNITLTSKGSSTSTAFLTNFPFTALPDTLTGGALYYINMSSSGAMTFRYNAGLSAVIAKSDTTSTNDLTDVNFNNNTTLNGWVEYQASE